jgi:hypothetical protein
VLETEDKMSEAEEALVARLRAATEAMEQAEIDLEARRAELAALAREAKTAGLSIYRIERETGYSRGHVYELIGPADKPRTAVRREQRRRVREQQ